MLTWQPHPILPIRGKKVWCQEVKLGWFYGPEVLCSVCVCVEGHLRIDLQQVVIFGVSSEKISDADHSTAERTSVLHITCVLLLSCTHPPCTHTQNNQCSSHACRLFGISNYSVEKCRLLPILMMCTTIYTSFLRSPLPRSWIKHQRQLISTDYSAWLLWQRFHLNTHHKKCALSFSLLGKLGHTVFIEFNKEPFTAKQRERTREMLSVYTMSLFCCLKNTELSSNCIFKVCEDNILHVSFLAQQTQCCKIHFAK